MKAAVVDQRSRAQLLDELEKLAARLEEAQQALGAIRSGDVDAVVVSGPQGEQVFSLTGAETVYRLTVETMMEAALNVTPEGCILFCNARFSEFVQAPMERVIGRDLAEFVRSPDRETFRAVLQECRQRPVKQRVVFSVADGGLKATHLTGHALHHLKGLSLCLVATDLTDLENSAQQIDFLQDQQAIIQANQRELIEARRSALCLRDEALKARQEMENLNTDLRREIEDRRSAETSLRHLNRTLSACSHSNQAMTRVQEESAYLEEVCRIVVEDCGHAMVWIGYADQDGPKTVRPVAWAGFEAGYLETLKITWADTERGWGPTGTAIRTGKPSVCRNMLIDPKFAPWRDQALQRGYASSIGLPLRADGQVFGALTIYSREADPFAEAEVELLSRLADDLAYGISLLRLRAVHQEAQEALRESEERLRLALEAAQQGEWEINLDTETVIASPRVWELFGADSRHKLETWADWCGFVVEQDRPIVQQTAATAVGECGRYRAEFRVCRATDGALRWLHSDGQAQKDDQGRVVRLIGVIRDNTERKHVEDRLEVSLQEKEVLLKEVHHRVKNNMQVISSLVDLQAAALDDPALRGLFQDVRDRVRSMALVHEKLYQSESLARVDLAEYTRSLLTYLWRAHGSATAAIQLDLALQPVTLPMEEAVPYGLVLNEVLTNALKHAFRGRSGGEIQVALTTEADGRVCLGIRDNGVGLPAGLDWRQSPSLGLRLVQMLSGQLHGAVELRTSGAGTEFKLTFAPPQPRQDAGGENPA